MTLVKKHNDPYKFLLAVIDQMNRGKLKLKRIGAATTREVAALWNDHNNNKIPASMVESFKQYITEEPKRKLNDPFRTPDGPKKFSVYVKNEKGNVVKVNFGDPNMEIKRDDPERRKSFRARHNCDNPGPKWKARYWSCYQWRGGAKVDN